MEGGKKEGGGVQARWLQGTSDNKILVQQEEQRLGRKVYGGIRHKAHV